MSPPAVATVKYRQSLNVAGGTAPISTSRMTPPPIAVTMPSVIAPTMSNRATRNATNAPSRANTNVPTRSRTRRVGSAIGWCSTAR